MTKNFCNKCKKENVDLWYSNKIRKDGSIKEEWLCDDCIIKTNPAMKKVIEYLEKIND